MGGCAWLAAGVLDKQERRLGANLSVRRTHSHACSLPSPPAGCWGANIDGEGGSGPEPEGTYWGPGQFVEEPSEVAGNLDFLAISAGSSHTCGLVPRGSSACSGLQWWHAPAGLSPPPPKPVPPARHSCFLCIPDQPLLHASLPAVPDFSIPPRRPKSGADAPAPAGATEPADTTSSDGGSSSNTAAIVGGVVGGVVVGATRAGWHTALA